MELLWGSLFPNVKNIILSVCVTTLVSLAEGMVTAMMKLGETFCRRLLQGAEPKPARPSGKLAKGVLRKQESTSWSALAHTHTQTHTPTYARSPRSTLHFIL